MSSQLSTGATPATVANGAALRAELARRLARLARVFDIPALRAHTLADADMVAYYEHCHDAYRKYHSAEGAVHMALNEGGRFDADGFRGQLRRIEADWAAWATQAAPAAAGDADGAAAVFPPRRVLELAFGQGYNLAWLAARHPATAFEGVDLTPAHAAIARRELDAAGLQRVALQLADYQALPQPDASFDALFCIEAFCHASDLPRAFGEAWRVLRPGGRFTLFDGYLPRPPAELRAGGDGQGALAVELVARGMAINGLQVLPELLDTARAAGFVVEAQHDLDAQVLPTLRRLERTVGWVLLCPPLGRWALRRRHAMRGRNVLAGTLMRCCVQAGLIGYRQLVLRKPGGAR